MKSLLKTDNDSKKGVPQRTASAPVRLCFAVFVALALVAAYPTPLSAKNKSNEKTELPILEVERLRYENAQLRAQLVTLERELIKLKTNTIKSERSNIKSGCDAQKLAALLTNVGGYDKSKLALIWVKENVTQCTTAEIAFLRRELPSWSSYSVAESLIVLETEYTKRK